MGAGSASQAAIPVRWPSKPIDARVSIWLLTSFCSAMK